MRDAAEIAQACADALWALDKASRAMGMKIENGWTGLRRSLHERRCQGFPRCCTGRSRASSALGLVVAALDLTPVAASRDTLWQAIRTALAGFAMQECINDYTR